MLVCELVVILACVSQLDGNQKNVVMGKESYDYSRPNDRNEESVSLEDEEVKGSDQANSKCNIDFHQNLGEFYYESLQQPIVETDVLVPIQREELPIPLNDRAKKREVAKDGSPNEKYDQAPHDDEDSQQLYSAAGLSSGDTTGVRNTAKCKAPSRPYPPSGCSRAVRPPLEMDGECARDPPFDMSWMTCDAEIQDWAYRRNSGGPEQKTRWNGAAQVAPSPSFKQIIDGFWREQSGSGFIAMYNKVKTSYEVKLEKREICGKGDVETQVYTKWDSLKDKVMEVRRDIRLRMIRKAELGQLSKPGMIFLREEELISEALESDRF